MRRRRGGSIRSSVDGFVMKLEQRNRVIESLPLANSTEKERSITAKPFEISKRLVWQAWRLVRANRGAAGVDEESLDEFERDVKNNLYRLWNRMSSGSYFPPPVREVLIPKKSGGQRPLGIRPLRTAWPKWSRNSCSNPKWNPIFMRTLTGIDPDDRHIKQSASLANAAGASARSRLRAA